MWYSSTKSFLKSGLKCTTKTSPVRVRQRDRIADRLGQLVALAGDLESQGFLYSLSGAAERPVW